DSAGGLAIEHYFPLDAEYVIRVKLAGGDLAPAPREFRIPVKAGLHAIGATFLRESAKPELEAPPLARPVAGAGGRGPTPPPPPRRRERARAAPRVLQIRASRRRFRPRHRKSAPRDARLPELSLPHRARPRDGLPRLGLPHRRLRAGVPPLFFPVEQHPRRPT